MSKYLILLFIPLLISCKKSPSLPPFVNGINMVDYPIKVGNSWTYQFSNNNNIFQIDTQIVTITGEKIVNNDTTLFYTQTTLNGVVQDTSTILQTPTSYQYIPASANSLFEWLRLTFPINQDSVWVGHTKGDTLSVIASNQTLSILQITFSHCYTINRYESGYGTIIYSEIRIAYNIGIIQASLDINNVTNVTIELIDYDVH